jgi:REP element-mobilizing transposase RayT
MPRRLRIEIEGAIYHVMARGNARQKIVRDDGDRSQLINGLEQSVARHGWDLLSYVVMGNHLHLMVKTPRPNLGAGMQSFLSGYAIWAGRRWRRPGHLFQGRYRAEMIEDENPVRSSGRGARQLTGIDPKRIFAAVSSFYGRDEAALSRRHDPHVGRAVAAWLCCRHTEASLRELAIWLGLSRADSVPNLTRRIETRLKTSTELSSDLAAILKRASSPDAGDPKADVKRTKTPPQSLRPKTKNKG